MYNCIKSLHTLPINLSFECTMENSFLISTLLLIFLSMNWSTKLFPSVSCCNKLVFIDIYRLEYSVLCFTSYWEICWTYRVKYIFQIFLNIEKARWSPLNNIFFFFCNKPRQIFVSIHVFFIGPKKHWIFIFINIIVCSTHVFMHDE